MARSVVALHSALASEAVADTLLRSIDVEVVPRSAIPWFMRPFWKFGSRPVCGVVDGNTFRLTRRNASQFAPNLFGKWETQNGITRIDGYFDLRPSTRWSLRFTLFVIMAFSIFGIVINLLDLFTGTHLTKDPNIGLSISAISAPFCVGAYLIFRKLGSRRDESLVTFLEQTLAASSVIEQN